jgi:hypothetical protein
MQHYYQINLNKGEDKAARIAQQLELQRWFLVAFFALIAAGVSYLTFSYNGDLDQMIQTKESKIAEVKLELQKLENTGTKLSKRDIMNLAQLENSRLLWAQKLASMGMEIPRDVALTNVSYEKGYLYVDGVHKVRKDQDPLAEVMHLVDQLKSNATFNDGDFESIFFGLGEDIISQDQPAFYFSIRCKIATRFTSKTIKFGKGV